MDCLCWWIDPLHAFASNRSFWVANQWKGIHCVLPSFECKWTSKVGRFPTSDQLCPQVVMKTGRPYPTPVRNDQPPEISGGVSGEILINSKLSGVPEAESAHSACEPANVQRSRSDLQLKLFVSQHFVHNLSGSFNQIAVPSKLCSGAHLIVQVWDITWGNASNSFNAG